MISLHWSSVAPSGRKSTHGPWVPLSGEERKTLTRREFFAFGREGDSTMRRVATVKATTLWPTGRQREIFRSPRRFRGDLGAQFVVDCLAERAEILRHHHEGSGAANHVVAVIGIKATRRIGVKVRYPLFAQDDETVNGDPFGNRLVTGVGDGAPFIVDAVTRYVDGVAVGVERRAGELRQGKIDSAADRGSVPEGAWCLDDLCGKILGSGLVANDGPVDDDLLLLGARPFHECDRDLAYCSGADRLNDAWIGDGRRIAVALQLEVRRGDAARNIGGENEEQVDFLASTCDRRTTQDRRRDNKYHQASNGAHPDLLGNSLFNIRRLLV